MNAEQQIPESLSNEKIDSLVDAYIDVLADKAEDRCFPSSVLGVLRENGGVLGGSFGSRSPKWWALKKSHPMFHRIHRIVKSGVKGDEQPVIFALLAKHKYRGIIPESKPPRAYNDEDRARIVNQELAEFRGNVKLGYRYFRRMLE